MMIVALLGGLSLLLVFLEFFLPGMVLATLGILAGLASSLYCAYTQGVVWGGATLLLLLLLGLGVCQVALWCLKRSGKRGDFYQSNDQEGYVANSFEASLVGKEAIVATELKPAGHIIVEGQLYQALSETGFISKGMPVDIVGGRGSHFIVRGKEC